MAENGEEAVKEKKLEDDTVRPRPESFRLVPIKTCFSCKCDE